MKKMVFFLGLMSLNVWADITCRDFLNRELESLVRYSASTERLELDKNSTDISDSLYLEKLNFSSPDPRTAAQELKDLDIEDTTGVWAKLNNVPVFEKGDIRIANKNTQYFYNSCFKNSDCQKQYLNIGKNIVNASRQKIKEDFFHFDDLEGTEIEVLLGSVFSGKATFELKCVKSDLIL